MKSFINSNKVKKIIIRAVEKALSECEKQHNANIDVIPEHLKSLLDEPNQMYNQPSFLKLKLEFIFDKMPNVKPVQLFCQPVIDLTKIEDNK